MYIDQLNKPCLDYAVHPGEAVREILEEKGMSAAELSRKSEVSAKLISQILKGKAPITAETALKLEPVLEISANLLNNMNAQYKLFIARQKATNKSASQTPGKTISKRLM